jgi:hypothetical protein
MCYKPPPAPNTQQCNTRSLQLAAAAAAAAAAPRLGTGRMPFFSSIGHMPFVDVLFYYHNQARRFGLSTPHAPKCALNSTPMSFFFYVPWCAAVQALATAYRSTSLPSQ